MYWLQLNTPMSPMISRLFFPPKPHQLSRAFGSSSKHTLEASAGIRLSTLLSKHLGLSRRQSERMILADRVTLFGKICNSPTFQLRPNPDPNQNSSSAMKLDGKLIQGVDKTLISLFQEQQKAGGDDLITSNNETSNEQRKKNPIIQNTRVWLANKLKGELVTEHDPDGRPSMLQRLVRGGVGESNSKHNAPIHLKPVGRLDMMTEGLMIFTNDGQYARELELPKNHLWRTYRVRVHGRLTPMKMRAMRVGVTARIDENTIGDSPVPASTGKMMKYKGVKVSIERKSPQSAGRRQRRNGSEEVRGTNTWLRITCTEGKNRQLRRILGALGLDVTRLIRISYGDYDLNTIPPGKAIEVPAKDFDSMKNKGQLFSGESKSKKKENATEEPRSKVEWVNYA